MKTTLITKRPEDRLDYDVKFHEWLSSDDTITAAVVTISEGTVVVDEYDFTDDKVKVWLSSGVSGETVTVTVTVNTAQNRVKEACFRVRVRARC